MDLALLQDTQQLRLDVEGQLADLVEEQTPAVRDFELTGTRLHRAGERAAGVPEELALGDGLGQRRAVEVDERLLGAAGALVQRAHDELLADAGLSGHKDREVRARDEVDLLAEARDGGAAADEHVTAARERVADELLRDAAAPLGFALQRVDQRPCAQRSSGERREVLQELARHRVERAGRQRIRGQHTDELALDPQRTAEASVHRLADLWRADDEPVIRVRQRAVGGKDSRPFGVADDVEARVLCAWKATRERIVAEPARGHRHQIRPLEPQQRDRVAGQRTVHCSDESLEAIVARKRRGDVAGERQQLAEAERGGAECVVA